MATRPIDTPFTPREHMLGAWVAGGLWAATALLVVVLVAWSAG